MTAANGRLIQETKYWTGYKEKSLPEIIREGFFYEVKSELINKLAEFGADGNLLLLSCFYAADDLRVDVKAF